MQRLINNQIFMCVSCYVFIENTYSAQKKKETFRPGTGKINFPIDVGQIFFAPVYYGLGLVTKNFEFLSLLGNSGPVSEWKLPFFEHWL